VSPVTEPLVHPPVVVRALLLQAPAGVVARRNAGQLG